MRELFQRDLFLRPLLDRLDEWDLISFDVFDTLLLRTVYQPEEVFLQVGKQIGPSRLGNLPPESYQSIRQEASRRARKKAEAREDITLEEIGAELASLYPPDRAVSLELEAEQELCFLNPSILSFLQHCRRRGKKIALVSDFYVKGSQLRELLRQAGLDLEWIDCLLVSGEESRRKQSGTLFEQLLEQFPSIPPQRMLHIGDHELADLLMPWRLGMDAQWYGVIPESQWNFLNMERRYYQSSLGNLNALRALAISSPPQSLAEEDLFWFQEGCGILGPFYTGFAEWILDQAEERGITCILPLMREGELIARFVRQAAEAREAKVTVQPLFTSRHGVGLLPFEEKKARDVIKGVVHQELLTLEDAVSRLYLSLEETPFEEYGHIRGRELKTQPWYPALLSYLMREETIAVIEKRAKEQQSYLISFLTEATGGKDAITVDLGYYGSTQKALSACLGQSGQSFSLLHLLGMGFPSNNGASLLDGVELRGWLEPGGELEAQTASVQGRTIVLEALGNASIGTVLSYRKGDQGVEPMLDDLWISQEEQRQKEILWAGGLFFQELWLGAGKKQRRMKAEAFSTDGMLAILQRLLYRPTAEEGEKIGALSFDDNMLRSMARPICSSRDEALLDQEPFPEDFTDKRSRGSHYVMWPEGVVARKYPHYYHKRYLSTLPNLYALPVWCLEHREKGRRMALYGVGTLGIAFGRRMLELGCPPDCMVDGNPSLWGRRLWNIPILSPEETVGRVDMYIITSPAHQKEIGEQVTQLYRKKGTPIPELADRKGQTVNV